MLRVGLTGGIACGKSLAGAALRVLNVPVCDADDLAREAVAPGEAAYKAIVERFGPAYLAEDGTLDRAALGRRVFSDEAQRAALNAIVHPEVMRRLAAWLKAQASAPMAVGIVPLLYEIGDEGRWDRVVCVAAPTGEQRRRLRARGLSEAEALARIEAQWPLAVKMERADCVLFNNGAPEWLERQVVEMWKRWSGA